MICLRLLLLIIYLFKFFSLLIFMLRFLRGFLFPFNRKNWEPFSSEIVFHIQIQEKSASEM